ncbi:MAG: hypothetical protein ACTHQQ_15045 [Solirubrobacteraceae bacterium]
MTSVAPAQGAPGGGALHTVRSWGPGVRAALQRNWLFAIFVLLGIGLRTAASVAYWPGLEIHADSYDYLSLARTVTPGLWHPSGYALLLALLSVARSIGLVVILQHITGIAMGAIVYTLALRLGARRWLAALASVPVLLDGYQVDLEQYVLAETLTDLLLLGGVAVLLWREDVGVKRAAVVGLLLAAAALTRTATLPVLIVAVLYLLARGPRWRPLLSCCAAAAVLLVGYGGWYAANWGYFGYSDYTGIWLYGRVAPFATCHYGLSHQEAELCPSQPVGKRSVNPEFWADSQDSPIHALPLGDGPQRNSVGEHFAVKVIEHQPLAYAGAVLADTWHYFTPGRWQNADHVDMTRWVFPPRHFNTYGHGYHVTFANTGFNGSRINASPNAALMGPLRTYQSIFYTPGPLLLACLVAALVIALGLTRKRAGRRHARWAALVLAVSAVLVVLSSSMFAQFSYRYGLPLLVLLPPAGAAAADIGLDALRARGWRVPRRRRGSEDRPPGARAVPVPATASNVDVAPRESERDLYGERAR